MSGEERVKHTRRNVGWTGFATAAALAALVAGCAAPKPAPPPPPPPPPPLAIPPQPRPPLGAPAGMTIPPVNAMGVRPTINTGVGPDQLLWNFRSAYNVAALDCQHTEHTAILENYKAFLKTYAKALAAANKGVDQQFGTAKGKANVRAREAYMTQVYNFYALPPTLPQFCDAALAMSNELAALPVPASKTPPKRRGKAPAPVPQGSEAELREFAAANLPKLDRVFLDFYNSYDQYRADLAAWQARYAPVVAVPAPTTTPMGTTSPAAPAPTPAGAPTDR